MRVGRNLLLEILLGISRFIQHELPPRRAMNMAGATLSLR
jgi:hypothetical protein